MLSAVQARTYHSSRSYSGSTVRVEGPGGIVIVFVFLFIFILAVVFGKKKAHHDGFVQVEDHHAVTVVETHMPPPHHMPPPMHVDMHMPPPMHVEMGMGHHGGVQVNFGGHGGFGGHH